MSLIVPRRDATGQEIIGAYQKIITGSEEQRFAAGNEGQALIFRGDQTSHYATGTGTARTGYSLPYWDVVLPFSYAPGLSQLRVTCGAYLSAVSKPSYHIMCIADLPDDATHNVALSYFSFFQETGPSTVRIWSPANSYAPSSAYQFWEFRIPYTSRPSAIIDKIQIEDQGDGVGIELLGASDGLVLRDPSNNRYKLSITDQGEISVEPLSA